MVCVGVIIEGTLSCVPPLRPLRKLDMLSEHGPEVQRT